MTVAAKHALYAAVHRRIAAQHDLQIVLWTSYTSKEERAGHKAGANLRIAQAVEDEKKAYSALTAAIHDEVKTAVDNHGTAPPYHHPE